MDAQAQIRSIVTAIPAPVLVVSATGRVLVGNEAAHTLFRVDGTGRTHVTLLRQPALIDAVDACLRDGQTQQSRYFGTEAGRDVTWAVTVAPAPLPGGVGAVLSFQDVTEVESAGQMRRDFVANVSHELRTPLTSLLGFVETLRHAARDDPEARDRFLEIMEREAGRMTRLVDDLLSLSRVEADERVRPQTPIDLKAVIVEALDGLVPQANAAGQTVTLSLPEGEVMVPGDGSQLRQVLTNLVENAIKYGGRGEIEVTLEGPHPEPAIRGDGVRLSVRDHGDGIAPHHIARLTERFYRVDTHRSREIGGTGLGLAIVKHIVNRHRGRLRVESRLGEGSLFAVILPAD